MTTSQLFSTTGGTPVEPDGLPDAGQVATRCRNLAELLVHTAESWPNSGIRYFPGDSAEHSVLCTHPSLLAESRRILGGLRARNLPPKSVVALLVERPEDFLPAFWACVLGGYQPCPLVPLRHDPELWATRLGHVNRLFQHPLVVTTPNLWDELPEVADLAVASLDTLRAADPDPTTAEARPEDVALLILTSGSTGIPKAVRLTHANLLASMRAKTERQELTSADVTLNWISYDHVAALLECHLFPLYAGAVQLQVSPQAILGDPLRFLELMDEFRVSMTFTPNFLLGQINQALADSPLDRTLDLSSVRIIVSGGEAIVCRTAGTFLDRLEPHGLRRGALAPAFGMTETCAGSIYSREFPDLDTGAEFASLGTPVNGIQMRIVDENDMPLPDGTAGELHLTGPVVFGGYHNNEEATAAAFTADGWFRSGDLGIIRNGRLSLIGRSKDSIIVNGVNYFSHDIETALEDIDGVRRSCVAAFSTRPAGSDTEQLVVAFTPAVPFEDELEIHRVLIAVRSSVVMRWGFRPSLVLPLRESEIPKTSLGKIQRSLLRRRLESGELAERQYWVADLTTRQLGGYEPPEGPTEVAIAGIFAEMFDLDPAAVSATASFFDIGGTSLDILRLKHKMERRLDVPSVPIVSILLSPTVRELANRLASDGADKERVYDPIVPLQRTGTKTPLFCVHPGVGEVLVFVNLAKYFTHERPFYALRARGFNEGESCFTEFGEMVECYVRAIRTRQPKGPYAVAGYSYGGAVAFEIAKRLEAEGERVDFVGIFNLPPHIKYRMRQLDFTEGAVNLAFFLSLVTKKQADELPELLRSKPREEQLQSLLALSSKERRAELDLDLPKFSAWAELTQSLLSMGRSYEPSGSVESVSVFYAIPLFGTKEEWLANQLKEWDNFTRTPNRYIDVAGEHYTLMGSKHVETFQSALRKELHRSLGGN